MYLSLDEKRNTFFVNCFIVITPCKLSNLFIVEINSVKFTINDPILKVISVKLAVFGPANSENLLGKNLYSSSNISTNNAVNIQMNSSI